MKWLAILMLTVVNIGQAYLLLEVDKRIEDVRYTHQKAINQCFIDISKLASNQSTIASIMRETGK